MHVAWGTDAGPRRRMGDVVGSRIGRYRVLARLGQGGMATVWKARDELLDHVVALKILSEAQGGSPQARPALPPPAHGRARPPSAPGRAATSPARGRGAPPPGRAAASATRPRSPRCWITPASPPST